MNWVLKVATSDRERAVAIYRYLQKVFAVKKTEVERVDDSSFKVTTKKEIGECMIRAIKDKFGGEAEKPVGKQERLFND